MVTWSGSTLFAVDASNHLSARTSSSAPGHWLVGGGSGLPFSTGFKSVSHRSWPAEFLAYLACIA